jgi:acetolactate synthase-1/2/3 large subunit
MKASDKLINQLEEEGVEMIFGLPGEENLDFLESLRISKIRLIVTRHEQAAAFMAATYGRLTGKAGVCFSTLGPGATNLVTGIAYAQLIGAPMISISGQKAIKDNWQAKFQLIDIKSLMTPVTKKSVSIVDPGVIPTVIREAFKLAECERPGAVHIELPEDISESECNAEVQKRSRVFYPAPNDCSVNQAADFINKSKYPLIIISAGANRNRISKELIEFIDKTGIYVVHTQMGKGVVPADNQYTLYATGIHSYDYVNCGIDKADLIITIGYNIVEYPPYIWNTNTDKNILNIDFIQSETDRYFNPNMELIGDISSSLAALSKRVKKRCYQYFERVKKFIDEKISETIEDIFPLSPQAVVKTVRTVMGTDDIITLDNGIYKLWFARLYKTYSQNTVLLDNALATMGAGLPSGIAAKIFHPAKKVLAICGDGGFMMNSQELETAHRYKIPIVVLLLNDNAYGFIKWKQKNSNFPDYGLDLGNPDFVKYAESYGCRGFRVARNNSLEKILNDAFGTNQPSLVDCPIDYSQNYEVFSKDLKNLVCRI